MQKFIAFLRGINVGGHRIIKMAELRQVLAQAGYAEVRTYIQSGNLVFASKELDAGKHAQNLTQLIFDHFGFEVPVMVLLPKDVERILASNPYLGTELMVSAPVYFSILSNIPTPEKLLALEAISYPDEHFNIVGNCIYAIYPKGTGKAKLNHAFFEKKLGVSMTTRNLRTMTTMLGMAAI
ncbi:DUF1697 domain-containing protein [Sediminicola luteus]|uniref:DUF1697 domain-containing protein n=1 Tax=Sediminicola luteus TaxID=319238 RepID=A0A2A4GD88_9FLAO|nr:DUF1697 domain-containing protein [Sediminicola luteus]PCE65946.1 hypothetical protein B7P33_01190 [Sediminicola luteus]